MILYDDEKFSLKFLFINVGSSVCKIPEMIDTPLFLKITNLIKERCQKFEYKREIPYKLFIYLFIY
jgi:hypothetical protein